MWCPNPIGLVSLEVQEERSWAGVQRHQAICHPSGRGLRGNHPCWHLDPGFQPPEPGGNRVCCLGHAARVLCSGETNAGLRGEATPPHW